MFEEGGPARQPFYGGFGLIAPGGIKKPSYYSFELFHKLGTTRIANPADDVIVTRREDGSVVLAVWNLSPPAQHGTARTFDLALTGRKVSKHAKMWRIDADHSNTLAAYERMGKPTYPTEKQVEQLNQESALAASESLEIKGGHLLLTLAANGFVLVELKR